MTEKLPVPRTRRRVCRLTWVLGGIAGLLAVVLVGFVVWANLTSAAQPEALAALVSSRDVEVQVEPWLTFQPDVTPHVGLVLYPGGRIDPRSYAPAAQTLALEGYLVVIPSMPLNLAVFAPERAMDVIEAFPDVAHWVVGGHSLGGAMAAHFAHDHPDLVDGVVLWAAYPASGDDLSSSALDVVSIYGSNDGLSTPAKVEAARPLLPPDTVWVLIEGGNHAQFGYYGAQPGDGQATISRDEQQRQLTSATAELLNRVGGP